MSDFYRDDDGVFRFDRTNNAFNYLFDYNLSPNEVIIVKLPEVTSNKRGINDIGWQASGNVELFGTLRYNINKEIIWDKIENNSEINKTVSALKIVNGSSPSRIILRAILN